jgi:mannose-1-phosphate guanylyltransferase
MAGGVGSRFWPASRESLPKQFLDITGTGKSLLRMTFERFVQLTPAERIFVVTNERYRGLVQQQLPEIATERILGEPSRNNTGPCVAYTAFKLHALDPEANFIVAPSDALIHNETLFLHNLRQALAFTATHDALVTLGIAPTSPHTGYGYIQFAAEAAEAGVYPVQRFTEKPDRATAEAFLASGDYLWNAGIFVWRSAVVLDAFAQYAPEIHQILKTGADRYNTPEEAGFIAEHYPTTPNISVDYAIMEHADNIYTLPAQFGWSDLGAWAALHEESAKDEHGNVVHSPAALLTDTHNSYVRAPREKLVVVGGVDDLLVIDEGDVLLVFPKSREQEIKALREQVAKRYGGRYL